jgi:uncharacterized protein HemY
MVKLANIINNEAQPRRLERHLREMIADPCSPERIEANNFLGVSYWHQNLFTQAIDTFKQTLIMSPDGVDAIWAMKMLSCLYTRLGLRTERVDIDLKRLSALRRMVHISDKQEVIRFACDELKRECDDRDYAINFD